MTDDIDRKPTLFVALLGPSWSFADALAERADARLGRKPRWSSRPGTWHEIEEPTRRIGLAPAGVESVSIADAVVLRTLTGTPAAAAELYRVAMHAARVRVRGLVLLIETGADQMPDYDEEVRQRTALIRAELPGDDAVVLHGRWDPSGNRPVSDKHLDELLSALDAVATPRRDIDGPLVLPVGEYLRNYPRYEGGQDRQIVHEVRGRIASGSVSVGDRVFVGGSHGREVPVEVLELSMFARPVATAVAGDAVRATLAETEDGRSSITRGSILNKYVVGAGVRGSRRMTAELRFVPDDEGGRRRETPSGIRPTWFIGAARVRGTLLLEGGLHEAQPGETHAARVELDGPCLAAVGEGVMAMRDGRVLATGRVTGEG